MWCVYCVCIDCIDLFAEQDFASGTEVRSSLSGTFVLAGLETDDALASLQCSFIEVTFVQVGWFRSQFRSLPVRVAPYLFGVQVNGSLSQMIGSDREGDEEALTARPRAKNVFVTVPMSFFSNKSTVWNTSMSGTPYALRAFWKFCTFSIILKTGPDSLIFDTDPGLILLMSLHTTTPSLRTSSYVALVGNFQPMISSIHAWASLSLTGSRFPAIYWKLDQNWGEMRRFHSTAQRRPPIELNILFYLDFHLIQSISLDSLPLSAHWSRSRTLTLARTARSKDIFAN